MHWLNNDDPRPLHYSFTVSTNPTHTTTSLPPASPSSSSSDRFPDASPPSYQDALCNEEDFCIVILPNPTAPVPLDEHDQELYEDIGAPQLHNEAGDVVASNAGRPPPPDYSIYQAEYEENSNGVVSRDEHLNEDPEALYQFLVTHNGPPQIVIDFHGFHNETRSRVVTRRNDDGSTYTDIEYYIVRVTDFHFTVDASAYVASQSYTGLYILPQPKSWFAAVSKWLGRNKHSESLKLKTVRELCEEYVKSKSLLKEIKVTKQIDWDYKKLTIALTAAIRHAGFDHSVTISYPTSYNQTRVRSDSGLSHYWDQTWVQILLFVTCFWVILWPIMWLYEHRVDKGVLKSNFKMTTTTEAWYKKHVNEVVAKVHF